MLKRLIIISIIICSLSAGNVYARGLGFYLKYSYGDIDYNDYNDDGHGIRNYAGIGLCYDSNVSTENIFQYRVKISVGYTDINRGYSDSWWYYRLHEPPFSGNGISFDMYHTFAFGFLRNVNYRLWGGPSIGFYYDVLDTSNGKNWENLAMGPGLEVGFNYHVNRKHTLEFTFDYYFHPIGSSRTDSAEGSFFSFKIGIMKRWENFRVRKRSDAVRGEIIADAWEESVDTSQNYTYEDAEEHLYEYQDISYSTLFKDLDDYSRTSALIIDTFPARCEISIDGEFLEKKGVLLTITDVPSGSHELTFSWMDLGYEKSVRFDDNQDLYVTMNKFTGECIVRTLIDMRFIENNDGTINDLRRNVMWSLNGSDKKMTKMKSGEYCNELRTANFIDWRIPSLDEMKSLVYEEFVNRKENTSESNDHGLFPFFNVKPGRYWTSNEKKMSWLLSESPYWFFDIQTGDFDWSSHLRDYYVLPVRWLKDWIVPEIPYSKEEITTLMKLLPNDVLNLTDYIFLDESSFAKKVYASNKPVLVYFFEKDKTIQSGLTSLFDYLKKYFRDDIDFFVFSVETQEEDYLQAMYGYESPESIVMYLKDRTKMVDYDHYTKSIESPEEWRQKFYQLFQWICSNAIDPTRGLLWKGNYYRFKFDYGKDGGPALFEVRKQK